MIGPMQIKLHPVCRLCVAHSVHVARHTERPAVVGVTLGDIVHNEKLIFAFGAYLVVVVTIQAIIDIREWL